MHNIPYTRVYGLFCSFHNWYIQYSTNILVFYTSMDEQMNTERTDRGHASETHACDAAVKSEKRWPGKKREAVALLDVEDEADGAREEERCKALSSPSEGSTEGEETVFDAGDTPRVNGPHRELEKEEEEEEEEEELEMVSPQVTPE